MSEANKADSIKEALFKALRHAEGVHAGIAAARAWWAGRPAPARWGDTSADPVLDACVDAGACEANNGRMDVCAYLGDLWTQRQAEIATARLSAWDAMLLQACASGATSAECVERLLERGADPNAWGLAGPPLQQALKIRPVPNWDVAEALLKGGADHARFFYFMAGFAPWSSFQAHEESRALKPLDWLAAYRKAFETFEGRQMAMYGLTDFVGKKDD